MKLDTFNANNINFDQNERIDINDSARIVTGDTNLPASQNNYSTAAYQTYSDGGEGTLETLDLSSYSDDSNSGSGDSGRNGFMQWCSNALSKVKDFFVGLGSSLSETAAAITNSSAVITDVMEAAAAQNNDVPLETRSVEDVTPTEADFGNLTQQDIINLVGKMDDQEYDEFITGVENYYDEQLAFLDASLNGEDGLIALRDRLIMFNINNNAEEVAFGQEQNFNEQLWFYYEQYRDGIVDFEQFGTVSYEEFLELDFDAQIQFVKEHEPYLIRLAENNEQFMREYMDVKVQEQLGDLGISTYDEYVKLRDDNNAQIELIKEMIKDTKNFQESAKYDYLYYREDYAAFEPSSINLNDYRDLISKAITFTDPQTGVNVYNYDEFSKLYPEVTPIQFIKMLDELYDHNTYGYNISGLVNIDSIRALALVSDKMPNFAKTYEYLYEQDPEKANQFLNDCKYEINNIRGQLLADDFLGTLGVADGQHDGIDAVANELGVSVEGLKDGLDSFGRGIYYSIEALMVGLGICEENRVMSPEEYKKMYILQGLLSQESKEEMGLIYKDEQGLYHNTDPNSIIDYTTTYAGPVLSANYEISQGIGNMVPSIIASYFCPLAGSITLGVSAGGNAYHSAMVDGQSYLSALMYGVFTGASEAVTERLLGGLPGLSDVQVTSLKTYLQAMAREGFQEGFQGVMDSIYQAAFMGKPLPTTVEEWEAYGRDILKQSAYGAITAGILQSPSLMGAKINLGRFDSNLAAANLTETDALAAIEFLRQSNSQLADLTDEQIKLNYGDLVLDQANVANVARINGVDIEVARIMIEENLNLEEAQRLFNNREFANGTITEEASDYIKAIFQTLTEKNITNLESELLSDAFKFQDLSDIELIRLLYFELGKKVDYSEAFKYFQKYEGKKGTNFLEIYDKQMDFTHIENGDEIICVNWAQLFPQILADAGIDDSNVVVQRINQSSDYYNGSHAGLYIILDDGTIVMPDLTAPLGAFDDTYNVKVNNETTGFIVFTNEQQQQIMDAMKSYDPNNVPDPKSIQVGDIESIVHAMMAKAVDPSVFEIVNNGTDGQLNTNLSQDQQQLFDMLGQFLFAAEGPRDKTRTDLESLLFESLRNENRSMLNGIDEKISSLTARTEQLVDSAVLDYNASSAGRDYYTDDLYDLDIDKSFLGLDQLRGKNMIMIRDYLVDQLKVIGISDKNDGSDIWVDVQRVSNGQKSKIIFTSDSAIVPFTVHNNVTGSEDVFVVYQTGEGINVSQVDETYGKVLDALGDKKINDDYRIVLEHITPGMSEEAIANLPMLLRDRGVISTDITIDVSGPSVKFN